MILNSIMEKKHNIVYRTTNLVNDKIYIGVHRTDKLNDGYLGSGNLIKAAVNKYGANNFIREVLHDFPTYKEARIKEGELVDSEFLDRSDVYNLMLGNTTWNKPAKPYKTVYKRSDIEDAEFERKCKEAAREMHSIIIQQIPRIFKIFFNETGEAKEQALSIINEFQLDKYVRFIPAL